VELGVNCFGLAVRFGIGRRTTIVVKICYCVGIV
jgi:hypothetical protein